MNPLAQQIDRREQYTAADHETWRQFFLQIEAVWQSHKALIHPIYLQHRNILKKLSRRIPTLDELRHVLQPVDWDVTYVDGYVPSWEMIELLKNRILPVSAVIRPRDQVRFAKEPDMIHDIFGHLPMLFSESYRNLLQQWLILAQKVSVDEADRTQYHLNKLIVSSEGKVASQSMGHLKRASEELHGYQRNHPSLTHVMDKLYFWIFEFGMVKHAAKKYLFGAGLLSSISEIEAIGGQSVPTQPLTASSLNHLSQISDLQNGYLTVPSFKDFSRVIREVGQSQSVANLS